MKRVPALAPLVLAACASAPPPAAGPPSPPDAGTSGLAPAPEERHLATLRQLTTEGENAEAYWSFDGKLLSLQRRTEEMGCDRIYITHVDGDPPKLEQVSSGKGATTCAHFLPGEAELIYASTHLGGDACPPRPDMSKGYVWALHADYDIFRVKADGTDLRRLTDTPGYDAEGTVCAKDGSIVFTSVRDGDIDLYRMDADGKNVKRLTRTPGYDGGAFFNADCTKIVWRASRPKPGPELEDYQRLLAEHLVRPTKLELYVANADGSEATQITYLDAASFAPSFFPDGRRVIFASNHGDPKGREFDLWAINVDGTGLERVTYARGFDGFPLFSPDGRTLVFSSNRATPEGKHDTNVFLARWVDGPSASGGGPEERILSDIAWLADPKREGRGIGTSGLPAAGAYLEDRMKGLGLEPGAGRGYRHVFAVTSSLAVERAEVALGGKPLDRSAVWPLGFSAQGEVKAPVVLAGYGISARAEVGIDDYAKLDVKGKIVLVRRFVPEHEKLAATEAQRRYGDLRLKAFTAREKGAVAMLVVDAPVRPKDAPEVWAPPPEAHPPGLHPEGTGDAGIPVVIVGRAALKDVLPRLERGEKVMGRVAVALRAEKSEAFNVVGRIPAGAPEAERLPGVVVIGAHYDHLGLGGRDSLAPERREPHVGADDNASGTAALLEVARALVAQRAKLRRDVVIVAFSGEEAGVLGSTELTRAPPIGLAPKDAVAMLNMDMVGRLRENRLSVLGVETATEWRGLIEEACKRARVECTASGDGYGPSDQTPFYAAGVPVLHFFTGAHSDYHKPSDTPDKINAAGAARVAMIAADIARDVAGRDAKLEYKVVASPAPRGDVRSFNASLGTIPDYAGPPGGQPGVLLSGVRPGGGADQAGMRRGDILVRLGKHEVRSVEDFMFVLNASRPGETVTAVVLREGKPVELEVTFQEGRRR